MTPQPGLQTIALLILPNISQSKDNQSMKFGQLIEYNKINIFLQKLCGQWGMETKMFLKLHSINWPNFIVWLPLLLEILGKMCFTIVS